MTFLRPGDKRDILIAKWELEYENVSHFKEFYRVVHEWLVENGWQDAAGQKENWEWFYAERRYPNGGPTEHRTWWRIYYTPEGSTYARYAMKIDMRTLNMKQVEVVVGGKKYKTWKGGVTIFCDAYVQLDYQNMIRKNKFLRPMEDFIAKRIYKPYWEAHKQELYRRCYDLNAEMKKFFGVRTPKTEPRLFRHVGGIPPEE